MSRGIDYGLGMANIDRETGIRFGVIPMHALSEWAWESFEGNYPQACPECGADVIEFDEEAHGDFKHYQETSWRKSRGCDDYACENCELALDSEDVTPEDPCGHTCTDSDYIAETHSDDNDVFILKSPYFTRAAFCSPCAPGACHLSSPCDDGERAYCFGHDWFEGDIAPYPVYSVKTGELVAPKGKGA